MFGGKHPLLLEEHAPESWGLVSWSVLIQMLAWRVIPQQPDLGNAKIWLEFSKTNFLTNTV
jgi:hypothetical protein